MLRSSIIAAVGLGALNLISGCGSAAVEDPIEGPVEQSADPTAPASTPPATPSADEAPPPDDPDGTTSVAKTTPIANCKAECISLPPQSTPNATREKLQSCLSQCTTTSLVAGKVYELAKAIVVPSGATLTTEGATPKSEWAELREVANLPSARFGTNSLVRLCSKTDSSGCTQGSANVGGTLRYMRLNLDNKQASGYPVNMVLHLDGAHNTAEYVDITNPVLRSTIPTCGSTFGPAVPVMGSSILNSKVGGKDIPSHDNVIRHSKIHGTSAGVFFHQALKADTNNVVEDTEIFMVRSNPVTFGGFGIVRNSHLHDNGWCVGDGLNGGAVYCKDDRIGGVLENNDIHDTCRDAIDFDNCWNMELTGNHIYNPGTRDFPAPVGRVGVCNSGQTMRLGVPHNDVIKNNIVENKGRPWNTVGTHFGPNEKRFSARGAAPYSDLPNGSSQSLAMILVRNPDQVFETAEGNEFTGNTFTADCNQSGCVGMGFFTTRATGIDLKGNWSAESTNTFRANMVTGSALTSRRCGANWFAASSPACMDGTISAGCNTDDARHEGHSHGVDHSSLRSCDCKSY